MRSSLHSQTLVIFSDARVWGRAPIPEKNTTKPDSNHKDYRITEQPCTVSRPKGFRVCSNTKTSLIAQIHKLVHTGTARAVSEPAAALLQLLMLRTHPECSTAQHIAKEGDAAASSAT